VTVTIAPGTVIKGGPSNYAGCGSFADYPSITVEGSLKAAGTSSSAVTFTSVNDSGVGGVTGTGSPAAGDWGGINGTTAASIDLENSVMEYATTGVNFSAGSSSKATIDSDTFESNGTAVSVSAAIGTNAQIENNSFTGNTVAINASSNWTTVTADPVKCSYIPTMTATGNTFSGSSAPLVTPADYTLITSGNLASMFNVPGVEDYPDGWADNIQQSSNDTIAVTYMPCIDVTSPPDSYVAIAIPLDLGG
jgi:hypothetical protein